MRKLIITLLALLSTPALVLAATAEIRSNTGAWITVCRLGGGYCTASSRLPVGATGRSYEYLLRVSRATAEAVPEIAILIAGPRPRVDATITVQVDRGTPLELTAGSGYRALALGGTYILDATAAAALLDELKKGKRVEFRYDTQDASVTKTFSLTGFTEALAFLEHTQGATLPATPGKIASAAPAPIAPTPVAPAPAQPVVVPSETAPASVDTQPAKPETPATPSSAESLPNPVPLPPPPEPKKPSAAATRTAQSPPQIPGRRRVAKLIRQFTCRASDPFWNLSIDDRNARFVSLSGSGEPQAVMLAGKLGITGEGRTPDVDWRGKSDTGASYRALINETRCVDSAADKDAQTQYDYRVQITAPGGKTLSGCCNAGLDTEGPQRAAGVDDLPVADLKNKASDDWTRLLLDLLPGMQACLEKTPGPSAYVTKAWPMNRGMVGTRTRNRDGGWFECIANSDGQAVEHIEMLPKAAAPLPGEQAVIFTPSAQIPPSGNCYRTERVQDTAGKWVGWLSTNGC